MQVLLLPLFLKGLPSTPFPLFFSYWAISPAPAACLAQTGRDSLWSVPQQDDQQLETGRETYLPKGLSSFHSYTVWLLCCCLLLFPSLPVAALWRHNSWKMQSFWNVFEISYKRLPASLSNLFSASPHLAWEGLPNAQPYLPCYNKRCKGDLLSYLPLTRKTVVFLLQQAERLAYSCLFLNSKNAENVFSGLLFIFVFLLSTLLNRPTAFGKSGIHT